MRTQTSRTGGNQLLDVLFVNGLPALVCFREGVVASRAVHPHQLQQYVMMDEIGAAVFEAWMAQLGMLIDSPQALVAAAALEDRRPRRQNSAIIAAEESSRAAAAAARRNQKLGWAPNTFQSSVIACRCSRVSTARNSRTEKLLTHAEH